MRKKNEKKLWCSKIFVWVWKRNHHHHHHQMSKVKNPDFGMPFQIWSIGRGNSTPTNWTLKNLTHSWYISNNKWLRIVGKIISNICTISDGKYFKHFSYLYCGHSNWREKWQVQTWHTGLLINIIFVSKGLQHTHTLTFRAHKKCRGYTLKPKTHDCNEDIYQDRLVTDFFFMSIICREAKIEPNEDC